MSSESPDLSRRLALKRLGLAAGAVYMAPIVINLSDAKASSGSSGGSGGGGGAGGGGTSNSGASMSMASMSEPSMSGPSMSGPSGDDTAGSGDGTLIQNAASAVVKAPGRMVNGIKGLFGR